MRIELKFKLDEPDIYDRARELIVAPLQGFVCVRDEDGMNTHYDLPDIKEIVVQR